MTLKDAIKALEDKAQHDWTNRRGEAHDAITIGGIQIGYDRALMLLRGMCDE